MPTHQFSITVISRLTLEHTEGARASRHVATDFFLEVTEPLNRDAYIDPEGLPTKMGSQAITANLVTALIGNIHMAHEMGWRDESEHLRAVIDELQKGFVAVKQTQKANF